MTLNKMSMNMGLIQGYVPVAAFVFESKGWSEWLDKGSMLGLQAYVHDIGV